MSEVQSAVPAGTSASNGPSSDARESRMYPFEEDCATAVSTPARATRALSFVPQSRSRRRTSGAGGRTPCETTSMSQEMSPGAKESSASLPRSAILSPGEKAAAGCCPSPPAASFGPENHIGLPSGSTATTPAFDWSRATNVTCPVTQHTAASMANADVTRLCPCVFPRRPPPRGR